MNGLQVVDLKKTGLADRLLKRRPKENAFLEINNILASVPILQINQETITNILGEHRVTEEEAKPRLLNLYAQVVEHFVQDRAFSNQEAEELQHLKNVFGLNEEEINQVNASVVYPLFQNAVKASLADRKLTEEEKAHLDHLSEQLHIPDHVAQSIYTHHAQSVFQEAINDAVADHLLSPQEEEELSELARNLNAVVRTDEKSQPILNRYRYLWRLSQGDFPELSVPIHLQRKEVCAAFVNANHHEITTITRAVRYSGFSASIKIAGPLRYRSGTVRTHRVTEEVMKFLDTGTLYFTSKRLLFDGSRKTTQIPLTKIIGTTFYADGLLVEKDSGKDQIFQFTGDIEALQLILDSLITMSRA